MSAALTLAARAIEAHTNASWYFWLALALAVFASGSPSAAALALAILLFALLGTLTA